MQITKTSQLTGKENTLEIDITPDVLQLVENRRDLGLKIQQIVPGLSAGHREFLISGITPEEWNYYFDQPDEYDNEKYVDGNESRNPRTA
jgi:hypothetical protein